MRLDVDEEEVLKDMIDAKELMEDRAKRVHSELAELKCKLSLASAKTSRRNRLDFPQIIFRSDLGNVVATIRDVIEVYSLGKRYGDRLE
jgi:hypothetical protein